MEPGLRQWWKDMKIADANIILRYLLNDHETLSEEAFLLFSRRRLDKEKYQGGDMMDNEIKQVLDLILNKLSNLEKRQESMEKRQDEIFNVVKAIEHSNNTGKADLDNLTHKVAHIEGTIDTAGKILQRKRA